MLSYSKYCEFYFFYNESGSPVVKVFNTEWVFCINTLFNIQQYLKSYTFISLNISTILYIGNTASEVYKYFSLCDIVTSGWYQIVDSLYGGKKSRRKITVKGPVIKTVSVFAVVPLLLSYLTECQQMQGLRMTITN